MQHAAYHTHTFNGPFSGTTQVSRYEKGKPIWILLKQETVSGSGISWVICKSAPRSRQITMPAPHHSVFLQARCPSCHPTNSVKALKAAYHCAYFWHWFILNIACVCVCEGRECRIPSLSRRVTAEFIDFLLVFSVKLVMSIIAVEYGFEYVLHTITYRCLFIVLCGNVGLLDIS